MKLVLTDFYHQASKRFLSSLTIAKINYRHVTIHYDGFLAQKTLNPFAYLIGAETLEDKDLHYNQIKVPEFYEIRNLDGLKAEILLGDELKGYIYYATQGHRLVSEVSWLDKKGTKVISERYNSKAFKYSEVLHNFEGKAVKEIYFNADGKKVLTRDLLTDVIVFGSKIFSNLSDFIKAYLQELKFEYDEILINSMSTPFFVSNRLANVKSSLYFQEKIQKEIPANMKMILEGKTNVTRLLFENEKEMEKVKHMFAHPQLDLIYLGTIERIKRKNTFRSKYLTLTRSDQILYDNKIAENLQKENAIWTIAAPSEISDKLRTFASKHDNVFVLEAIRLNQIESLLSNHDIYLDLNQGTNWENIIQKAYLEGMLVLSDRKTAKNPDYELVFEQEEEFEKLLKIPEKSFLLDLLHKKKGKVAQVNDYKEILS
ncbi:MAG: hypothetical protein ACK5LM_02750 [Lactovum sp.]